MASELHPETLRKKQLAMESLPEFLARMTLVWEDRQRRLAGALERGAAASRRAIAKAKAVDPEGFRARHLAAAKRYAERHPDRIEDKKRRAAVKRAAARAAARDAKRASQPEGYPKAPQRPARRKPGSQPTAVVPQDSLSRAWFGLAGTVAARHENSGSPALSVTSD